MFVIMGLQNLLLSWFFLHILLDGSTCSGHWPKSPKRIACNKPCSSQSSENNFKDFKKSLCSCTRSCTVYGDCCYDSPWKNKDATQKKNLVCLPVTGYGHVSVVNVCLLTSPGQVSACDHGFHSGPPVTSLDTGISYLNSECALCNKDARNLQQWPVSLKCCSAHDESSSSFVYLYRQKMWSMNILGNGTRLFCECQFTLAQDGKSIMDSLETRCCQRKEIATCSFTWKDNAVKRYCDAYLDPIYKRDKMYRNKFCAICNYERDEQLHCTPQYQDILSSYGLTHEEAFKYCSAYGMEACLAMLTRTRGKAYSSSRLFSMEHVGCIPPEDRMCCDGERYDFKFQKCRKIFVRKN